jgi:hypothetical protein
VNVFRRVQKTGLFPGEEGLETVLRRVLCLPFFLSI